MAQPARAHSWDPVGELATAGVTAPEQRGAQTLAVYRRWGGEDGEAAVLHAEAEGVKVASASLREAFGGWLAADADAAKEWVKGMPAGRRSTSLAGALGEALDGPLARAEWAADLADGGAGQQLMSRALSEWGRANSPASAIGWLENNGGLEQRTKELGQLMRSWADHDAAGASEALAEMQPGSGRDAAVSALVTIIAPEQAEAARTWAETIGDEQKRTELLALVAKIGGGGGGQLEP